MKCSRCCYNTEMILTRQDIERIEKRGYKGFYKKSGGFYRLVNINGRCIFLGEDGKCTIYNDKPLGCGVYPLIYNEEKGVIIDDYCPLSREIDCLELIRGISELRSVLKELENTYNYRVDWRLFEKSSIKLIERCFKK